MSPRPDGRRRGRRAERDGEGWAPPEPAAGRKLRADGSAAGAAVAAVRLLSERCADLWGCPPGLTRNFGGWEWSRCQLVWVRRRTFLERMAGFQFLQTFHVKILRPGSTKNYAKLSSIWSCGHYDCKHPFNSVTRFQACIDRHSLRWWVGRKIRKIFPCCLDIYYLSEQGSEGGIKRTTPPNGKSW